MLFLVSILAQVRLFVKHEKVAYFWYNLVVIITYQGGESFKVSQGELALVINPKSKTAADVTIFSSLRNEAAISEKSGFVIDGPGEYEIKDIFIKGFPGSVFL